MKVLYFHQHFSTLEGSTGTRSYEMALRLIARGHRVTMVCGSGKMSNTGLKGEPVNGMRRGMVDGIDVIEFFLPYSNYDGILKRTWNFLRYSWRGIGLAMSLKYDLLFATSTPLTAGIPGIAASLLRRKPFVFEIRDLWPEGLRAMGAVTNPVVLFLMSALEWLSYHSAKACIGLSPGMVAGIVRRGIPARKVTLVPNGCDTDLFHPDKSKLHRNPPPPPAKEFLAVFTGAHGRTNGLGAVLDAAAELKKKGRTDIKIGFIGDGVMKPSLVKRAADEKLDNCVFMDPVSKLKLIEHLGAADAGLMILSNVPAFYFGTSPNKFFDYIAMGLPVVVNHPGWLAEMITKNGTGIAVEPENPKALASALERLADSPQTTRQYGVNARALAEREFDRKDLSNRFVDFLERACP